MTMGRATGCSSQRGQVKAPQVHRRMACAQGSFQLKKRVFLKKQFSYLDDKDLEKYNRVKQV